MNRTMTVTQLSTYLKGVFDDEELLHDVTLTGEITEISYSDKHTFLTIADGACSVRCVHFSARDKLEKGMRVALRGSVSFYGRRNSISFNYSEFFVDGLGDKNAKLAALKQKLADAGYFTDRPQLPKYVADVVVVTSPDGAAIRDFMRVVYDKCPFVNIRVYPVRVQGDGAAAQMAVAVERLQACDTDAIILCRGGGSDEDLDSFNDESLATAVALSEIPVVSAVGHEINYSLCDHCAGTRAGTPSIAGEIINSHAMRMRDDMLSAVAAMRESVAARYSATLRAVSRLGAATTKAVAARVSDGYNTAGVLARRGAYAVRKKTDGKIHKTQVAATALRVGICSRMSDCRRRYELGKTALTALDPHRIIKIGYAAVLGDKGRITSAARLDVGQSVRLVFADGEAVADVRSVRPTENGR